MFLSGEKFLFKGKEYPLVYKKKPVNVFEFDGEKLLIKPNELVPMHFLSKNDMYILLGYLNGVLEKEEAEK